MESFRKFQMESLTESNANEVLNISQTVYDRCHDSEDSYEYKTE